MAFVDVASDTTVIFATGSHGDETLVARGGQNPAQLKWSDLHPPGVRVLPRGSPPAGSGELNWEDTLGAKFAAALRRLEGMLYALYGSRPGAYEASGGGWDKCQWYDRVHPRCLWAAEVWHPNCLDGPPGCASGPFCNGACWEYDEIGEYAALGDAGGMGYPAPQVPIRSRSGDPLGQYRTGVHDGSIFPFGSVERDASTDPFDPEGRGWFGATHPGRNDAGSNPFLKVANGYVQKLGEDVKVRWTQPGAVTSPTSMTLYYQLKPPGGSFGGWSNVAMSNIGGDVYEGTIPKQDHGTACRWYLKYFFNDPDPGDSDITAYEPGGDTQPADAAAHSFTWFYHYNPFGNGLPELLDDYGGVDVRHGTDFYEFDGSESVQAPLINLARWTISAMCGTTCLWSDIPCSEGEGRPRMLHHSPRVRGQDACCIEWPIRFYWSGSNQHPHYRRRGKGEQTNWNPLDTRPLKNLHDEHTYGSTAARMSWAGIEPLYSDNPMLNPEYGDGASYAVPPFEQVLQFKGTESARVYAQYHSTGLRPGDVIDPVHIQEVIDAVDYLINFGAWTDDGICTSRKQPPGDAYLGMECGREENVVTDSDPNPPATDHFISVSHCEKCCANSPPCSGEESWHYEDGELVSHGVSGEPFTCEPPAAPTLEDCLATCNHDVCHLERFQERNCLHVNGDPEADPPEPAFTQSQTVESCNCDQAFGGFADCGQLTREAGCQPPPGVANHRTFRTIQAVVRGWCYYACVPAACRNGWDANHGGAWKKNRFDHTYSGGLNVKATGPPGAEFSGNCLGDVVGCGEVEPGFDGELAFGAVRGLCYNGLASSWLNLALESCTPGDCQAFGWSLALPPPIPGLGHHDADGNPMCTRERDIPGPGGAEFTQTHCQCNAAGVCEGPRVWVAADFNLDGSGFPYAAYQAGWSGAKVPRLRNYDLTKDPATWMHVCPCETWTGAAICT